MENNESNVDTHVRAQNAEILRGIVSDEFQNERLAWLIDQINGEHDSAIGHVGRLIEQAKIHQHASYKAVTSYEAETKRQKWLVGEKLLMRARDTFGQSAMTQYRESVEAKKALTERNELVFWGTDAANLFSQITKGAPVLDDGIDREDETSPTQLPNASKADYVKYLQQKRFIEASEIVRDVDLKKPEVVIKIPEGEVLHIPVSSVVSAARFDSWVGRGFQGQGDKDGQIVKEKKSSIDTIIDFAERDTDIPNIAGKEEGVEGYIQPNGTVLYVLGAANHRGAAMIARGQQDIPVAIEIGFRVLETNVLEATQQ